MTMMYVIKTITGGPARRPVACCSRRRKVHKRQETRHTHSTSPRAERAKRVSYKGVQAGLCIVTRTIQRVVRTYGTYASVCKGKCILISIT
jgi:hypothetical protein